MGSWEDLQQQGTRVQRNRLGALKPCKPPLHSHARQCLDTQRKNPVHVVVAEPPTYLGNRIHMALVVAEPKNPKNPKPCSGSSEPQLVQLYMLDSVALGQGLERDALDLCGLQQQQQAA